MKNLKRAACVLAVVGLAGGGLIACGDDDDERDGETTAAESESVEEVTLVADDAGGEYTFELSATPTPETERIVFDNQGSEPHALIFGRISEDYTLDEAFELQGRKGSAETWAEGGAGPGKSQTIQVEGEITPGEAVMLCPITTKDGEPHYKLGQLEEFTIE